MIQFISPSIVEPIEQPALTPKKARQILCIVVLYDKRGVINNLVVKRSF